jgi:hypothetical protein
MYSGRLKYNALKKIFSKAYFYYALIKLYWPHSSIVYLFHNPHMFFLFNYFYSGIDTTVQYGTLPGNTVTPPPPSWFPKRRIQRFGQINFICTLGYLHPQEIAEENSSSGPDSQATFPADSNWFNSEGDICEFSGEVNDESSHLCVLPFLHV